MNFGPSRASAIENLNKFVDQNLFEYSRLRNFDFGPDNRSNVSCLSPYITHGVISELEVIKKSLNKFSFSKNEKFIQEVLWRTYWKGWLELRPVVWMDYLSELKKIREEFKDNVDYKNATEGNTNIECFNEWVKELKKTNYLHNHVRMWFASIWVFTLDLPWHLGAEFFMKHLYDGDAASNTLGWRWVAGIQTQGKNYLASEWNIKKFTNNRFSNIKLSENAPPKVSGKAYSIVNQDFSNSEINENQSLLIFENNLSFELTDFKNNKFKKIYLIFNKNENRSIKLSEKVLEFKTFLTKDQEQTLKNNSINCEVIDISEIKNISDQIIALYPTVGENLDYLNSNNLKLNFLYRKLDQYSWQYCNKSFFNFKNYIPKIISTFN